MKSYLIHGFYLLTIAIVGTLFFKELKPQNNTAPETQLATVNAPTPVDNHQLKDLSQQLLELSANVVNMQTNMDQQIKTLKKQVANLNTAEQLAMQDVTEQETVYDDVLEEYAQEDAALQWYYEQESAIEQLMDNDGISLNVSESTASLIQQAINTHGYAMSLNSTSCSETACKVEAKYDTKSSNIAPNIDELVYANMQWDGPILSNVNEETGEITLFMLMPGETAGDLGVEG